MICILDGSIPYILHVFSLSKGFFGQNSWKSTKHYKNFLSTWKLIFPHIFLPRPVFIGLLKIGHPNVYSYRFPTFVWVRPVVIILVEVVDIKALYPDKYPKYIPLLIGGDVLYDLKNICRNICFLCKLRLPERYL